MLHSKALDRHEFLDTVLHNTDFFLSLPHRPGIVLLSNKARAHKLGLRIFFLGKLGQENIHIPEEYCNTVLNANKELDTLTQMSFFSSTNFYYTLILCYKIIRKSTREIWAGLRFLKTSTVGLKVIYIFFF